MQLAILREGAVENIVEIEDGTLIGTPPPYWTPPEGADVVTLKGDEGAQIGGLYVDGKFAPPPPPLPPPPRPVSVRDITPQLEEAATALEHGDTKAAAAALRAIITATVANASPPIAEASQQI